MIKFLILVLSIVVALFAVEVEPASAGTTYYIDSGAGDDNNNGLFPIDGAGTTGPWRTLSKINAKTASSCSSSCAVSGDKFRLVAGSYWYGETVHLDKSGGLGSSEIRLEKYGPGTDPIIHAGGPCIDITGHGIRVKQVYVMGCSGISQATGIRVTGYDVTLEDVDAQGNQIGIYIKSEAFSVVVQDSTISNNQTGDGTGASGIGLLLHGSNNWIHHNTFENNYWVDTGDNNCRHGAAIEVFGGEDENADDNAIERNLAVNNEAFTEMGIAVDQNGTPNDHSDDTRLGTADDNSYQYNVIRGNLSPTNCGSTTQCSAGLNGQSAFITRGDGLTENVTPGTGTAEYGPVLGTTFSHNSIYFTGECAQGIVCSGDCMGPDVLVLTALNNISQATWKGAFIGNVSEFDWDTTVDYSLFRKTSSTYSGGQHCQFQSVPCPAMNGPVPYSDDPLFTSSTDLHVSCSSPAIDAGSSPYLPTDYEGTAIPQNEMPDIGAYERIC